MERGEKGEYRWVHAKHLYRDWGSMKLCFTVFSLIPVGAFVFFTMFFPAKPGQRMAMRQLLYDSEKKEKHVDLIMLKDFACDEKRGKIAISTLSGAEEIHVPREDYAEVLAFIEEILQKRKRTGGRKKASATDSKEKEVKP